MRQPARRPAYILAQRFRPTEQELGAQIHQIMKSKEEFEALKQQRDTRQQREPGERSACLMASCPSTCLQGEPASAFGAAGV